MAQQINRPSALNFKFGHAIIVPLNLACYLVGMHFKCVRVKP